MLRRSNLSEELNQEKINQEKLKNNLERLQKELTDARSQLNVRISQLEDAKSLCKENEQVAMDEMQKRFDMIDSALGVS